jgi:hypothetical protein
MQLRSNKYRRPATRLLIYQRGRYHHQGSSYCGKGNLEGATSPEGEFLWHGLDKSAPLSNHVGTKCDNGSCTGAPNAFPIDFMPYFLVLDPTFSTTKVNTTQFDHLFRQSVNRYESILGAADPDLTCLRKAGGKLINWHGVTDSMLGVKYTQNYAQEEYERDQKPAITIDTLRPLG